MPNFEAPKDAGKDNVYNITVVATDSDGQTDEMDVIVTVTNVEEDGTVTLSLLQPRIGSPVTATLSDIDGAVSDVKWQWARTEPTQGARSDYVDIEGATEASYTPVTDDPADDTMRCSFGRRRPTPTLRAQTPPCQILPT